MKTNMRTVLNPMIAGVLVAALAFPILAQGPPQVTGGQAQDKSTSISKVERKNRAPVSKDLLKVKIPRPFEAKLENGLTVLILEDHRFPTVSVQLNISGAGGVYDPPDIPGLASTTAQMLREGTGTRASKQIAEDIDRLGATFFASAGQQSAATGINASGLSDNLDEWFALVAEILLTPSFPADELNNFKNRQKATLRQQRAQPGFLANERFSRAVFGGHPAAVVSSNPTAMDAMTSEKLAAWHKERYAPQNAILGIAGDVDANALVPKLKKWLGPWAKTDLKEELPPPPAPAANKKIYVVDRPGSVQTTLWFGNIGIDRRSPDWFAVRIMSQILGGGPAGRLFINLRENKGYTYGYYSGFDAVKWAGPWYTQGDVRTEVTEGAATEVVNELTRLRDEKVPADELADRKNGEVASFALSLESPATLLNYAILRKIYGFPEDYWDTYPLKIAAVTADDVQRVAQKYINMDSVQVVAVGEGSKIVPILEKFGPVEVWTTEGKPAPPKAASN